MRNRIPSRSLSHAHKHFSFSIYFIPTLGHFSTHLLIGSLWLEAECYSSFGFLKIFTYTRHLINTALKKNSMLKSFPRNLKRRCCQTATSDSPFLTNNTLFTMYIFYIHETNIQKLWGVHHCRSRKQLLLSKFLQISNFASGFVLTLGNFWAQLVCVKTLKAAARQGSRYQ